MSSSIDFVRPTSAENIHPPPVAQEYGQGARMRSPN
jgi:hypothetical protein